MTRTTIKTTRRLGRSAGLIAGAGALTLSLGLGASAVGAATPAGTSGASPAGPATTQAPAAVPDVVKHVSSTEYVSRVAPTDAAGFAQSASLVPTGAKPAISCGQVLTDDISTSWDIAGTNITLLSFSSVDYTTWCSGRVYTESYHPYCRSLTYGVLNFTCLGGWKANVIGQGTSEVNPWYNQPVMLTYWAGSWEVKSGTAYARNYMWSNGATNEWVQNPFSV